jgi:hypothetical protein
MYVCNRVFQLREDAEVQETLSAGTAMHIRAARIETVSLHDENSHQVRSVLFSLHAGMDGKSQMS